MIPDAGDELARAVRACFVYSPGQVEIAKVASLPWASITFSGARHRLMLQLRGPGAKVAAASFLDGLQEREFRLRGHIVADIAALGDLGEVGEDSVAVTLDALTVVAA